MLTVAHPPIKVSEYASWSTKYYSRVISACLKAAGAPADLVQFVTGYGDAGNALVTGGADKVIFVGSVEVGKMVMRAASESLTPVILELGGKDAFIVCDDADAAALAQLACRGVYQNMGQNCAGPERFIVYEKVCPWSHDCRIEKPDSHPFTHIVCDCEVGMPRDPWQTGQVHW